MNEVWSCSDHGRRTHDPCDKALHDSVSLLCSIIRKDEFARPPVATTIFMEFEWSCGAKEWFFFEDDQKDHLKGTIGFAHHLEPRLDEPDWVLIRNWVDGCLQRHQLTCISPDPIDLPGFEVIDCKARKLVPGNKGAVFAALSYVWGSSQTQGVLPDRTTLPNPFPEKVIEDALACTYNLKIPYLWVDRYCIDQDDTSDTKQHLIQSMDKIYSAARVTIINVAGDDASTGLPGVSTTLRVPSPSRGVIYGRKVVPVINPKDSIITSKWAKRGWTLQESLLARRRLVFTNTQVYFQCTRSHCVEGILGEFLSDENIATHGALSATLLGPRLATQAFPSSVVGSHLSKYSIARVCDEFAKRDLSMTEDALRACLGIFSRLWASEKPSYQYCGLPFQANSDHLFAVSLMWKFDSRRFPGYSLPIRRSWGPSWSWIAWKGYMGFEHMDWELDHGKFHLCVDIKLPIQREKQEMMSTINDYMEDIDGDGLYQQWLPYLELSGWIATMAFEWEGFNDRVFCYSAPGQERVFNVGWGHITPAMWAEALGSDQVFDPFRMLSVIFIAYEGSKKVSHCLVIRRVGEEKASKFERLGTCKVRYGSPKMRKVQGTHYMIGGKSWDGKKDMDLECRFETITLV